VKDCVLYDGRRDRRGCDKDQLQEIKGDSCHVTGCGASDGTDGRHLSVASGVIVHVQLLMLNELI
jgi:hypothetical protein